jgi:signal transduction histidine kinase/ActR/RegA family two-component response regulator
VARLESLERSGEAMSGSLDPARVVETVAAQSLEVSGAAAALLFRLDVDAQEVRAASWAGQASPEMASGLELPADRGPAGAAIAQGRPVWTSSLKDDAVLALPAEVAERMGAAGFHALIALPVVFRGGTTFGALVLLYREARTFSDDELQVLAALARQAAVALENARAFERLSSRASNDAGMHELTQRLLEATDEEVVRTAGARFTMNLLGADFVALFVADRQTGELRLSSGLGWGPGVVGEIGVAPTDETFAGYAYVHKTAVFVEDLVSERRFSIPAYLQAHGVRGGIVVPLGVRQQPVGALAAYYRTPRRFSEEESRVLTTIAEETALALARVRVSADQRENLHRLQDTQAQVMQADKLQALGTLLSGLAHELNNPLSTIQLSVQLMKRQQTLPDNVRRRMDAVEDECDRATRIIRDLLVFAKRKPPERRPVDVNEIVQGTLQTQVVDFGDKIRVVTELGETPPIMADPHQIQQVLLNLFTNARHAMEGLRGFGTLTVRSAVRGGEVLIEVEDDGPGIAPENLGRIFDPFFTTKSTGAGSGLGLSLSIGIVQAHGGTIQAASVPGTGARFIVHLPTDDRERGAAPAAAPAEPRSSNGRRRARVLVVDDEVQLRATLTDVFEALGHDVESVGSGAEALTRLAGGGFDFVSLDMRLPDIDGKGIWRELQRLSPTLAQRVVFMTGDTMSPEALQFLQETGRPVLTKPLSIDRVGRIVEEVLSGPTPATT